MRLAAKNKPAKYFKYAVGEIVLVVLGILIALQINNWNESQKRQKQILSALVEIKKDLTKEIDVLEEALELKTKDIDIQVKVIEALEEGTFEADIQESDLGRLMLKRDMSFSTVGFDLLKEIGINEIKDNELRNHLILYYEIRILEIKKDIIDDEFEFKTVWLPFVREHFSDWQYGKMGRPRDVGDFVTDEKIRTWLKMNNENSRSTVSRMQVGLDLANEIVKLLDDKALDSGI